MFEALILRLPKTSSWLVSVDIGDPSWSRTMLLSPLHVLPYPRMSSWTGFISITQCVAHRYNPLHLAPNPPGHSNQSSFLLFVLVPNYFRARLTCAGIASETRLTAACDLGLLRTIVCHPSSYGLNFPITSVSVDKIPLL